MSNAEHYFENLLYDGMSIDILKMRDIMEHIKNGTVIVENDNTMIPNETKIREIVSRIKID